MPMGHTDNILRMLTPMINNLATGPTRRVFLNDRFDFGDEFVEAIADLLWGSRWVFKIRVLAFPAINPWSYTTS